MRVRRQCLVPEVSPREKPATLLSVPPWPRRPHGQSHLRQDVLRIPGPVLGKQRATHESEGTRLLTCPSETWSRWSRCAGLLDLCPLDSVEVLPQVVSPFDLPRDLLAKGSEFVRAQVTSLWRVPLSFDLAASASTAGEDPEYRKADHRLHVTRGGLHKLPVSLTLYTDRHRQVQVTYDSKRHISVLLTQPAWWRARHVPGSALDTFSYFISDSLHSNPARESFCAHLIDEETEAR